MLLCKRQVLRRGLEQAPTLRAEEAVERGAALHIRQQQLVGRPGDGRARLGAPEGEHLRSVTPLVRLSSRSCDAARFAERGLQRLKPKNTRGAALEARNHARTLRAGRVGRGQLGLTSERPWRPEVVPRPASSTVRWIYRDNTTRR